MLWLKATGSACLTVSCLCSQPVHAETYDAADLRENGRIEAAQPDDDRWIIGCSETCSACSARKKGVLLSVAPEGRTRLLAPTTQMADIYVEVNGSLRSTPDLFGARIAPEVWAALNAPKSFLVIKEGGVVTLRVATGGITRVRDRLLDWQSAGLDKGKGCQTEGAAGWGLQRALPSLTRQAGSALFVPSVNVPVTKPQVEFAIRGQAFDP